MRQVLNRFRDSLRRNRDVRGVFCSAYSHSGFLSLDIDRFYFLFGKLRFCVFFHLGAARKVLPTGNTYEFPDGIYAG